MKIKTAFLFLAALAVVGISGCASDDFHGTKPTLILGHPNLARFKGRPFVLRTVSTDYLHSWSGDDWDVLKPRHCLADWVYEKELRYDLDKGWRYEHLDHGTGAPVPVDVVIRVLESSHNFWHGNNILTDVKLPGATIQTFGGAIKNSELRAMWKTDRFLIPTAAMEIIDTLHYIQIGNPNHLNEIRSGMSGYWGGVYTDIFMTGHMYGIRTPMSGAEMHAATGLTSEQFSKMCEAGGGK